MRSVRASVASLHLSPHAGAVGEGACASGGGAVGWRAVPGGGEGGGVLGRGVGDRVRQRLGCQRCHRSTLLVTLWRLLLPGLERVLLW